MGHGPKPSAPKRISFSGFDAMAYVNDNYQPNAKSREILARAWEHVQGVEYQVTARWLFYRLLQDGFYSSKADYEKLLALLSRARHNQWESWRPDSLIDDGREAIVRGQARRKERFTTRYRGVTA